MSIASRLWLIASAVGAGLAFFGSVNAVEAMNNVSSWAVLFGMDGLAQLLASETADLWAQSLGLSAMALGSALWWVGRPRTARASEYQDQVIRIADFVEDRHAMVNGKIFKRCLIVGPVRLSLLNRNAFNLNSASSQSFFVAVPEGHPRAGSIALENVEFFECYFDENVTIEATPQSILELRQGVEESVPLADWKDRVWSKSVKLRVALTRA